MVGAFVYYSDMATAEAWTKEVAVLKRNLNDSFNTRARVFTFVVSDPKNIKDDLYYPYRRVKLVDTTPDTSVFLGRIEMSDPYWDNEYGQCLKITCIDYSRELYERKLDVDYTVTASPYITAVPYKRSDLIKQIVYDHSYSGNITLNVEDSGSSDLISRDYSGYDRAAIQEIETLSAEDYWTDETWATNTPSGSVWRFNGTSYVNDTINADTVTGSFYWWLGTSHIRYLGLNNPFLGIWLNLSATGNPAGIKYEYWAGTGWVELVMSESFDFTTTTGISRWELPSDWSATAFSSTWPHNGYSPPDTNSRYWVKTTMTGVSTYPQVLQVKAIRGCGYDFYTDDSQVFQRFRRGSKPSGGGENGLTIELNGTNGESTRAMMHDYSFSEQAKELITRVTVRGHDEDGTPVKETATNTTLEDELKIIRERTEYVWGKEMTNSDLTTYCANRANALLEQHAGTYNTTGAAIVRGQVSIIGYPYYGPSKTLVRVGDLVRVKCAPKSIDEDMLVQEIIYDETNIARLKLISVAWGRNFSPFELTSVLESLRLGGDVIISQARINDLVVNEAWINTLNAEKILVNSASGANILTSGINNYATVLISGGLIVDGSINVIKLGSDATDRFFDSSGNANAVQNWIIDSTEINGGYIKTNTVSLNKLVAVPMGLLLDPSFEYSPTGQTCGEGWEIGYGANMTDQIIENSGVARNGTKYLQFVPYATTATERHWYSDPWIKVNQGDIITFGGYISCTGLNSTMGFKLIGADSSFATSELDSTSFIGGSFSWMIRESTYQITGSSINWVRLHCCLNNFV